VRGLRKIRWLLLAPLVHLLLGAAGRADDLPRDRPEDVGLSADGLKRLGERFRKAVADGQIAGAVVLVARQGKVAHLETVGMADVEAKSLMGRRTVFRIASMSKPVTSVAALMLVEAGKLKLDDPVSKYLPEFKGQQVLVPGKSDRTDDYRLVPAEREMTVRDLLRHTSGLIYPGGGPKALTALYKKAHINPGFDATEERLADNVRRLARLPLAHQPGERFTYGLSTDVLGRVVEVVSGQSLEEFFRERIFRPLRMNETGFLPAKDQSARVATLYRTVNGKLVRADKSGPVYAGSASYFSGGAGLFSTADDYARFLQMLLNGGELDGVRLLKAETVKEMTRNQIGDLTIDLAGVHGDAFGLGFGVVTPRSRGKTPMSVGSYSWAGAFYTYFWVDPRERLFGVMMTQAFPSDNRQLWKDFVRLTYGARTK
jgi:CubicO group peptidase (beta-lactamase class C family)